METRKVKVQLARLLRETADVFVEIPAEMTDSELEDRLREIYDSYDDEERWTPDDCYGCDRGECVITGPAAATEVTDVELDLDDEDEDDDAEA